jgi:hypothetical protein
MWLARRLHLFAVDQARPERHLELDVGRGWSPGPNEGASILGFTRQGRAVAADASMATTSCQNWFRLTDQAVTKNRR